MSGLPGILADVEAVSDTATALELARRRGGTMISISSRPGSALAKLIGVDAAAALVERLGRGEVMVPMANARGQKGRRAAVAQMIAAGATVREAALACDVHDRTVWRIKYEIGEVGAGDQPDLFRDPLTTDP